MHSHNALPRIAKLTVQTYAVGRGGAVGRAASREIPGSKHLAAVPSPGRV